MMYSVRYVHKISPSDKDRGPDVKLTVEALLDKNVLARILRNARVLQSGGRLREFRVESSGRVVAFPASGIWHAIILTKKA